MNIETLFPSDALKPYIEFYYFIRSDDPNFNNIHYSFPHTVNAVSIYQQASFDASAGKLRVYHDAQNPFLTIIQSKCQKPLRVEMSGKTNRITIWFKPLGINHFINHPLAKVMNHITQQLIDWDKDSSYQAHLESSFSSAEPKQQIQHIEDFLLRKFRPLNTSPLEKAVALLDDFGNEYHMQDILNETQLSLRTFNRHFKQSLGVSPIEYRRIAQFRHSLNNKLFSKQFKRLTDIGYESNFYDQSYFIKLYKKLTGANPKSFFSNIEKLGNDNLIFQFVKK